MEKVIMAACAIPGVAMFRRSLWVSFQAIHDNVLDI